MASEVEVQLPESILTQTSEEEENDAKIQQCQRVTEVDDTIHETEKDEQQEKDLKVSKGDYESTDGESFLYPPTVEKAANSEVIEKMSETSEARETSNEERSLQESLLSKIESETVVKEDIPHIGISENDNIKSDGKEITGILDRDVLSQDGNDSEKKEKKFRKPMEHGNEEASEVSQNTKIIPSEVSEKYNVKGAEILELKPEINISDKFAEVPASESDLQKRKEADSNEKEESIENIPTEVDSSQQTEVQTIDQSLPGSNPKVIESSHNVGEEQCSEENIETGDIPIEKNEEQKRSTSLETSILEKSNGNHSFDETLETHINESEVAQVEENATELTSTLVDGKIDETQESEVITEEYDIEADAKEITGTLDSDLPKNENDSSIGNDSAENEDENHNTTSEIEKIEQDKQGSAVLSEESTHNEDSPQVSKGTEFTPLEGSAKEEPDVNDTDLVTSEKNGESIHVDEEQCSEENIETRDIPIEKNEEQKRSTSPETSILEKSNGNNSLEETLETPIQESEVAQVEENATELTSLVDGKIDESQESEVIREEYHNEAGAKEITGILDGDLPKNENDSSLGNDSAENEDENHNTRSEIEQIEQDKQGSVVLSEESIHNEDAPQVSEGTEFTPLEGSAKKEPDVNDINLVMSEKKDENNANFLELQPEINISDEFAEVSASASDLQKRKEADSDEKEEPIENIPTEVDSSQQIEVQTIDQSLPGSNPKVTESIHNVDEEQCSEENIETRDIPIEKNEEQKRSTSPETSILEQSNENHSLDETLETSIQESEVSQVEENATELTSSLVDGKIDESQKSEVTSEDNHIEADAKEITSILDGDLPKNENDSSLGNDSAETEDENHDTRSKIEQLEQDKQESVVLEESIHNEEGPQVSKDTGFIPLEGSAKEEAKVNDINLETGKAEGEKVAASLEPESEKIQETDMEMNAPQNEQASDEKDVPAEVEITQQLGVETFEESLPRSNTEVNESIDSDQNEHCTEEKIESRDFPIENIEELKRSTSLETGKFEKSNKNLSLDETLDSVTQKSEASQLEENAAEPISTSAEKIDESVESEVTRDENHDLTLNATIEEDSKAHHTEESLTDSHPITEESAKNVEEEPTEVENEEAQPVEQEATLENIESRHFPIEKTEELERSNAPETTTLEKSNEKMSLEETLDSSKEYDMSSTKENATIDDTAFPVAEQIDDTPENLKAEVDSSIKSIEIEGEADLSDKERDDVIQDVTEVEDTEAQTVIEKEIIDDEEKTNGVDEDSSQQHDDKNTAESNIGEKLVTDTDKDAKIVDCELIENQEKADVSEKAEFEERNAESSIESKEDIEASQDHSEKTNTSNDEAQLIDSDNFTDAITTRENPEPVDDVEELDAKSGAAYDDSLASEQEAKPNEHPLSEENNEGQAQSVPTEDPIYKSEDTNQEATEVENQETNIVKEEAKGGDFQDVFEREIADDEVKTSETDEKSSQQRNENPINSDIAETEDDGDKAYNDVHVTDMVEKERIVDRGFQESNFGNSITNDDGAIEAPQSHTKSTNVSNDEVQLLELKEEAETDKQLENVKDEDSSTITDGTAAEKNPEPVDAVDAIEKLETVTKLEAIDDNCDASDEANKSETEGSSTIAEYENEKSSNQDLGAVVIEDETNDKEVQLSRETQSQREEAIDEDLHEVASDEEESKAANEQSETEESQQNDNTGDEKSVEHKFEESISSNEKSVEHKIEELAAFKEQEENLEQEDPTSIIDNVSEEEEATVVENKETQIFKEEAKEEVSRHVVEREIADDELEANKGDEKLSQTYNENATESDITETQEDGDEAHKIHGTDIVEKEKIVDREFEEINSGKSIGNEEATIEASQIHEENTNVSHDVDQLPEPQESAKIEKQLEDVENEEDVEVSPSQDGDTEIPDDTNQVIDVQEEVALREQEENIEPKNLASIIDYVSAEEENFEGPNLDPPRQLDERTSTESENIESEVDEEVHESGRFNETRELDTTKSEEIVKQEETSDNTIGNEDTIEPSHDENPNIYTNVIQVIEVHGEVKSVEQEEKLQNENPSIIVDGVSLEENPKQDEDIEELERSTKSSYAVQEEQIDNHGLSVTEADNKSEDEESMNKGNVEIQEAKGEQLNEVIQSTTKEALDENIQPPYEEEKFVDAIADSQQNDESSLTQIYNTEVQMNENAYEESGNEEIQGKETHEESGHEEIHGNETPTDEEIVDQRLEEIESGNATSNQESTKVSPSQDEVTVISDDGNQATDVQEQNPGPADEAEKYVTGEKITVVENPDVKSPENLFEEGHTEDEDFVNNEGVPNQSSEPVDADEKFDLKEEATEGQDLEETPNMKPEASKEDVQREGVGEIWNDKGGEVACESSESNETREIDSVQDDEKVNEDSNNATNKVTIASYPSEDENANISNDEIQVIGLQEKAKIEEQPENIEDENSSNILEDVSREENVKPAEDDIYTKTEDIRSEEGFQLVTNDEEKITDGNTESPQKPRELDNSELQREENVHEQSDSNEIHRTDKVFDEETMESNEEQNQELIEASTLNIGDENPIVSQNESNNSNEETKTEVLEEGTVEAQLDGQKNESPVKSADGAFDYEDKKLDNPESGSQSTELSEAIKAEEEKTNMGVNDLEGSSTGNTTESRSTVDESLITKDRGIDLAECTLEKEEEAKLAEVCQINIQTQDIDKRESKEEDLQQPILEKRKDYEVKPMDSKTDNSRLENEKDINMSDEQYKSVEMDGSDLDKEKDIMNEGIQAAALSNRVQNEHSITSAEATEQNADVEKDTLSQDVSLYISNDPLQVVEANETEVTDRECQPHESEDLEIINNISSGQVEEVKDDLKEERYIQKETIEKKEKQGADSGEVKFSITNMSNVEEETDLGKDSPVGNIVNTLDVFLPKEIQQDNDGDEDILPEIEQLENPVREEMAENGSSQTNEQELEMKNGHTSTTEDNENIMVVQVPKEEMTGENSLEKAAQDTQDELVSNSEFEPTKDSKLKEELVEEAGNINESSFSSEQSKSSEKALNLSGHESIPIQAEETDEEMVKNEVSSELILEEKQCEINVEAQDATDTKLEEVKYMDEPSSTHKTEAANTEVNYSLHEGIKESNAEETPAEQASVKESEKAENVEEENLKEEDEKQMVTCYDNMPSSENITLVKDETISQESHRQGNIKETLAVSSAVETEQVEDRKQFSPEAEEVISTPQLEHESRDVSLSENNANQPTEKLHVLHTDREVMLPDCQDVEEVSAVDIIASQIARAIEEEEQRQQQSSEQQIERHEATERVPDIDENNLESQVPNKDSQNSNSLDGETEDTYFPEERGIEIEVQKDMHSKQEMVEKVDDSEMSGTEDLPSASPDTGSPSKGETNKVSGSSMDSSSQEILNEQEIKDSTKSEESNSSPQVNTINTSIPEENSANSCTTHDNEGTASLAKEPEIPTQERTISEKLDQDKHQKIISSEFMEDGKTVLTSEVNQTASCDAATEQIAELKVVQETSQGFPHEDTKAQSQHKDPLASARSVEDDEKPAIIAKTVEVLDEKVQHSKKTIESPDRVEKAITEVEEKRTEFTDTLDSGKREAVAQGKVSPVLDIPETQVTVVVPGTPEATEERKTIILTDDFDSPTEQNKPQNEITVKESIIQENQQVQAPRGLEEGRVEAEDGKNEGIQQKRGMNELENTKIVETKTRSMDSSVITALTSQEDGHKTEKVEQAIFKEEKTDEKEVVPEEVKTDEEQDESVDQSQEDLEQREMPITAEALGEMEFKATHKKSHNILFGVGSKVKHSISKMKKAIACSTGQFSQEDVIIKVNKNKKA